MVYALLFYVCHAVAFDDRMQRAISFCLTSLLCFPRVKVGMVVQLVGRETCDEEDECSTPCQGMDA